MHETLDPKLEHRLISEAKRRQQEAFRALYRHYFPRVYAYVAYRVQRAEDAEDLTADIFTKIVESLAQFEYRGEGSFAAWVFRIAQNRVSQFYRQTETSIPLDELPEFHQQGQSPDEIVIRKERFAWLSMLIDTLTPRRREIITLRFFGGLRNQEIAIILGLDERTVAAHLSRALTDLQDRARMRLQEDKTRYETP